MQKGEGEIQTGSGKRIVAIGMAWQEAGYGSRRQTAHREARGKLRAHLGAYMEGLARQLANRFQKDFGIDSRLTYRLFRNVGERVTKKSIGASEVVNQWERLIQHEVYVRLAVEESEILQKYWRISRTALANRPPEMRSSPLKSLLRCLENELNQVSDRPPRGNLVRRKRPNPMAG
jgi:hypothetical protein